MAASGQDGEGFSQVGPLPKDCRCYTDGGIIGPNPSDKGGTWAVYFVSADGQSALGGARGLVRPSSYLQPDPGQLGRPDPTVDLPTVENNLTELIAAVEALERLPDGWAGTLYTDSKNTLRRLTARNATFGGVPYDYVQRLAAQRKRLGPLRVVLLDGHPTQTHLLAGRGKRGKPVSIWNALCNWQCDLMAGRPKRKPVMPTAPKE